MVLYRHCEALIDGLLKYILIMSVFLIPRELDTHSTANWTVIPRVTEQFRSVATRGFCLVL